MAKLRQAVEHNLRQIDKLRYLNAFVTEADEYARKLLDESAHRHSEGALLINEPSIAHKPSSSVYAAIYHHNKYRCTAYACFLLFLSLLSFILSLCFCLCMWCGHTCVCVGCVQAEGMVPLTGLHLQLRITSV